MYETMFKLKTYSFLKQYRDILIRKWNLNVRITFLLNNFIRCLS